MQRLFTRHRKQWRQPYRQRGVALFVVIVFVMLSMLLALWATRASLFNEMVVGNDADYQRAYEAAQALLQDAELDIRGETSTGSPCSSCHAREESKRVPLEDQDTGRLLASLNGCEQGLCPKISWDFSNDTTLPPMGGGARYGQFTGASAGDASAPVNPILADTSADNRGGWYWIEVMIYDESSKNANLILGATNQLPLHLVPNVAYRITAMAYGRKPNTMVLLQQTYVRQKYKD